MPLPGPRAWQPPLLRSYLYVPGSAPELLVKAHRAGPDAVIFDLEDAVAASQKDAARSHVADAVRQLGGSGAARGPQIHVRVNRGPHGYDRHDLAAVVTPGLDGVRLPKSVDPAEIAQVGEWLDQRDAMTVSGDPVLIYPTVESAAGVTQVAQIATAHWRVARIAFGAADFLADIGVASGDGGAAATVARGTLVLRSRAAGIGAPVDNVHPRIDDEAGLRQAALAARAEGFSGKSVIHPRQLAVVHQVFSPTAHEAAAATDIIAAYDRAAQCGVAALAHHGDFVDPAVVARARTVLALQEALRERTGEASSEASGETQHG